MEARFIAQKAVVITCIKRSCQRHTQVFDLPVWGMISLVPTLWPSTGRFRPARHACEVRWDPAPARPDGGDPRA